METSNSPKKTEETSQNVAVPSTSAPQPAPSKDISWIEKEFQEGKRLAKEKKYDDSIVHFSNVIKQAISAFNNDELHPELARLYYEYGNILLQKIELTSDVFGEEVGQTTGKKDERTSSAAGKAAAESGKEEQMMKTAGDNDEEEGDDDGDAEIEEQATPITGGPQPPKEEEVEDLQLAWENMELSRNITTKALTNVKNDEETAKNLQKNLMNIHIRLGDLQCWKENFVEALQEYLRALEHGSKAYDRLYSREIAEVYFLMGRRLSLYQFRRLRGASYARLPRSQKNFGKQLAS